MQKEENETAFRTALMFMFHIPVFKKKKNYIPGPDIFRW